MHYKVVTPKERRDRLRLFRTARIGAGTYHEIMEHFGHATAALEAIPQMARNGGARPLRPVGEDEADRELEQIEALGGRIVTFGEPGYPPPLMLVKDAPPAIAVIGRADLLARDMVAVVGARNATANGRRVAREMGSELGVAGLTVVSGLARGIDRAAHEGSLGNGTVAVVAGGVDVPYPEENRELYEQICEVGVVVSEIAPGIRPTARHFPRRNRIISGLSLGVVIVEAAERSGSLITARLAMEQGREVFGVPGSPTDPRSRGPNRLIRDGANLVRDAADVIETLRARGGGGGGGGGGG
ncbi:MAG: DNA-processing protein DprA, partial [Alphaproteobacteria bacterium]|nr:DNA-processing protein DprA [Alphaproteobacteria bacterium]